MDASLVYELKDKLKEYDISYQYCYITDDIKYLVFYKDFCDSYDRFTLDYQCLIDAKDAETRLLIILNKSHDYSYNINLSNKKSTKLNIKDKKNQIRNKLIEEGIIK